MKKKGTYICYILICVLFLLSCRKDGLCDDEKKILFDSFENRLKIDPGFFQLASETDTIDYRFSIDFDGFTNSYSPFRLCKPDEYENYWTNYTDNGTYLYLFKEDFQMQLVLIFNETRFVNYQVKKVDDKYQFFEPFTDIILEGYSIELLPTYQLNNIEFENVIRIQAKNDGRLQEELIYQRENGILTYQNLVNEYRYDQIGI